MREKETLVFARHFALVIIIIISIITSTLPISFFSKSTER